jgi:drug/metabolite transporter (DMT)-like permease
VILGILAAFSWGTGDFVSRLSSNKVGYYATATYGNVFSTVVLFGLIKILNIDPVLPPVTILTLLFASLAFFSAYVFAYRGFQSAPLSVIAPIAYTAPAIATVFSILLLSVTLSSIEALSLMVIMMGVVLLSMRFSELRKFRNGGTRSIVSLGVMPGLLSAFSFAFVFLALSIVVPGTGYLVPILYLRGFATVVGFVLAPVIRQNVRPTRQKLSPIVLVIAVVDTLGFIFLSLGLASAKGSLPLVIMASGMGGAFLVGYGIILLKEKPEPNQLLGIAVSVVGVASLLYLTA